jgi:hypothetical protein
MKRLVALGLALTALCPAAFAATSVSLQSENAPFQGGYLWSWLVDNQEAGPLTDWTLGIGVNCPVKNYISPGSFFYRSGDGPMTMAGVTWGADPDSDVFGLRFGNFPSSSSQRMTLGFSTVVPLGAVSAYSIVRVGIDTLVVEVPAPGCWPLAELASGTPGAPEPASLYLMGLVTLGTALAHCRRRT